MEKIIAQLWNGNLEPVSHLEENNAEIRELVLLLQRNFDKLESILNEHQKDVFIKYNDCIQEYLILSTEQAFCDGFCYGTKLTVEALTSTAGSI